MNRLLIDVGNTRVKWGVSCAGKIVHLGHRVHRGRADVVAAAVVKAIQDRELQGAVVSNVAGAGFEAKLTKALSTHLGIEPRFAKVGRSKLGVRCGYRDPTRLGVDRWLAVVAAHKTTSCDALVIDAGTTLTIDAVTAQGDHLGGVIIPGIHLMARALQRDTSDIGPVTTDKKARPGAFLGRSTSQAVNLGSWFALRGAVDQALACLQQNNPRVLVTGGDGEDLVRHLRVQAELRPSLVLEGLALFVGE